MGERVASIASTVSYATSGSTIGIGALTANEIAAVGGLALGVLTFLVNWYYRHKQYQLVKSLHEQKGEGTP